MKTYTPNNLINDCIKWDTAKRACNIPQSEIDKKVAEIFPQEKIEKIKDKTQKGIEEIFRGLTL